jgi:hypothetical protein
MNLALASRQNLAVFGGQYYTTINSATGALGSLQVLLVKHILTHILAGSIIVSKRGT